MKHLLPALLSPLLAAGAVAQLPGPSTDVSMGVFPFLVGNMDNRVHEIVNACHSRGIDTIYVSVFRATGPSTGDLWITDRAGNWNTGWGPVRPTGAGIDLQSLIDVAHQSDLRVVGVLKCFDDSVQPTNAAHRAYLLDVVGYLVDSFRPDGRPVYDLDGLALDYVRFVSSGTGNDHTLVTNFVRDVKQRIRTLSLHAYLLANRYTFDGPSYDLNFASYSQAIGSLASQFGQHWPGMAQYVDVMMPMCYTADGGIYNTYAEHRAYVRQAALYCSMATATFPGRRVIPVVKTYSSSGETTTDQTVEASIVGALEGGDGYQAFRYGTMTTGWWSKMQQFAVPGPNFPMPVPNATVQGGLSATLDLTQSRDADEPASALQIQLDWNDDGVPDTAWLANVPVSDVLPSGSDATVGILVQDSTGQVSATRRRVTGADSLAADQAFVSVASPIQVQLTIDAGPAAAGATYLVLGSISGTTPGTPWLAGFHVPLNLDFITDTLFLATNTPAFQNALGQLDASGQATATFSVPANLLTPLTFHTLRWAAIAVETGGVPLFVTNATGTVLFP